jgi:hypothetical protein
LLQTIKAKDAEIKLDKQTMKEQKTIGEKKEARNRTNGP